MNMRQHKQIQRVTEREYKEFQQAYDVFNKNLFDAKLPQCLITLSRQANSVSYFVPEQFSNRKTRSKIDEISLNPDSFSECSDEVILSNLVHEMCHIWDYYYGKKSRPTYHSSVWVEIMCAIGLEPISLDGSKSKTGQKVSHEIVPEGLFKKTCNQLLRKGFSLNWQSINKLRKNENLDELEEDDTVRKTNTRAKFVCPECGLNAWAKPTASLICGNCKWPMTTKEQNSELGIAFASEDDRGDFD